jgi:hypothetical protein
MPLYTFQHPKTKEVIEITQSMTEKHIYVDSEGVEWSRVWDNNYQVGVITRELIQGKRKISNVNGESIPKSKMKDVNRNFKYQTTCNQLPDNPAFYNIKA